MKARGLCWIGVALLATTGCAVERKEFDALREQVLLQQRIVNDLKARQEEQVLRVDAVNNGFRILGDKAEENSRRIDDLTDLVGEIGAPLPLAAAPAPAPKSGPAPAAAPAGPAAAVRPLAPPEPILLSNRQAPAPAAAPGERVIGADTKPDKLYVRALQTYNARDYEGAARQFRAFVEAFPDHILAGNAQYWIGECFYTRKRFAEAAEEFAAVERRYPDHRKVPDALLKEGLSLRELGRGAEASAALEKILAKYPKSEAAPKARDFLARWK